MNKQPSLVQRAIQVMEWRVPVPARVPLYSAYAWATGADLSEVRYPLDAYYSLAEFFSRTLVDGARPVVLSKE